MVLAYMMFTIFNLSTPGLTKFAGQYPIFAWVGSGGGAMNEIVSGDVTATTRDALGHLMKT